MILTSFFAVVAITLLLLLLQQQSTLRICLSYIVTLFLIYVLGTGVLGRPKPLSFNLIANDHEVVLVGSHLVEDVAIYLWTLDDDGVPRSYVLPWSLEMAEQLREAGIEAEEAGTMVVVDGLFRSDGEFEFDAAPVPPEPAKGGD